MEQYVCASANPDKVAEISTLLEGLVELLPRPEHVPDVVEDAPDLVGNARLKARALCHATGLPAISDDTGLEVDVLDGAPGVHTARFAGDDATYEDNRVKVLSVLAGIPLEQRTARFRTVAMVAWPNGDEIVVDGVCDGRIALHEAGDRGFGYDAVFIPDDDPAGRTFAEMSEAEKHAVSHRGRAFRALVAALTERSASPT